MSLETLLDTIQDVTVPACAQCDGPMAGSPSLYWCNEACQQAWQELRGEALKTPARRHPMPTSVGPGISSMRYWWYLALAVPQPDPRSLFRITGV